MANPARITSGRLAWLTLLAPPVPLAAAFVLFRRLTAEANRACTPPLDVKFPKVEWDSPTLAQYAADLQGRYLFGVLAFLLLLAAIVALASSVMVISRARPRLSPTALGVGFLLLATVIGLSLLFTTNCLRLQVFDYVMCDGARCLGSAEARSDVAFAMAFLLVARGLALAAALAIALAALVAVLDPPAGRAWTHAHLYRTQRNLRNLLILGTVVMVFGVFSFGALFDWSTGLLPEKAAEAAGALGSGGILYWGAMSSLALMLVFGPAYGALWNVGQQVAAREQPDLSPAERDNWLKENRLSFTLGAASARVLTALLPLLSAPVFEALSTAVEAFEGG